MNEHSTIRIQRVDYCRVPLDLVVATSDLTYGHYRYSHALQKYMFDHGRDVVSELLELYYRLHPSREFGFPSNLGDALIFRTLEDLSSNYQKVATFMELLHVRETFAIKTV